MWFPAGTAEAILTFAVVPPYSTRYRSMGDSAVGTPSTVD